METSQAPATRRRVGRFALFPVFLLLPAFWAGTSIVRERSATRMDVDSLKRVPLMSDAWDAKSAELLGAREGVIIARLDTQGGTVFRTATVPLPGGSTGQMLDMLDARLPPWQARDEVRAALAGTSAIGHYRLANGSLRVLTLAQPVPGSGLLYILKGSRRTFIDTETAVLIAVGNVFVLAVGLVVTTVERRRRRADAAVP